MSQNHFTLMCLQVQHLVLESATLSVRIPNTRSCAALWAADLESSRQDAYQWSQLGKIDQKDYQNMGNVTKHFGNLFYRFAKAFKCLQRNRCFHNTSPN